MDLTAIAQTLIWACVVVGLVLFALHKFENAFASMVGRVRKVGPAEFEVGQAAQHQVESTPTSPPSGAELIPVTQGTVLAERVEFVRQGVNLLPPEQRLEQAVRAAGFMAVVASLEYANGQIYGSQLELLQLMNSRAVSISEAQAKYGEAAAQFAEQYRSYAFEAWLDWLINHTQLVIRSGDSLSISDLGRELLKYIAERGYPFHRSM